MRLIRLSSLMVFAAATFVARADTIRTFDINGSSVFYGLAGDRNTVTGTVVIDTTNGVVQSISILAGGSYQEGVDSQQALMVYIGPSQSKISFDAGTLQDYMGSTFDLNGPNDLYVGHITPSALALTPEPGSLVLLATGLAAVLTTRMRRPIHQGL